MRRKVRRWLTAGIIIITIVAVLILPRIIGDVLYPYPEEYREAITAASEEFGVNKALIAAVIRSESNFRPTVRSHAGATGMMQLMPGTAQTVANKIGLTSFTSADLYDSTINIRLGTAYLKMLLDQYNGDEQLALAGYNGGPGTANNFARGGTLPRETQRYIPTVLKRKAEYEKIIAELEAEESGQLKGENPEELTGIRKLFSNWFK